MSELFFLLAIPLLFLQLSTIAQNNNAIDVNKGKGTINKNNYGHFAEYLGGLFFNNVISRVVHI